MQKEMNKESEIRDYYQISTPIRISVPICKVLGMTLIQYLPQFCKYEWEKSEYIPAWKILIKK